MGRAMLIIVAGVLVTVGIIQTGIWGTLRGMDRQGAQYAESIQAKNIAYAATEQAMQDILDDPDLAKNEKITKQYLNNTARVSFEENCEDPDEPCKIDIKSEGKFNEEYQGIRMTVRKGFTIEEEVVEGTINNLGQAMAITDEAILHSLLDNPSESKDLVSGVLELVGGILCTLFGNCPEPPNLEDELSFLENAEFNGNDASGKCKDEPGIKIPETEESSFCSEYEGTIIGHIVCPILDVLIGGGHGGILGDPIGKAVAENLNLDPVFSLVDNLETQSGLIRITEPVTEMAGLGSPEKPGVFFIENPLHLAGGEGYGIMIVRQTESTRLDVPLLLAENFTFHGLVILDNIFTNNPNQSLIQLPNIKGSLMITNSSNTPIDPEDPNPIEIDIPEGTVIQYDCSATEYIEKAIGPQIINVYEQGRVAAWEADV